MQSWLAVPEIQQFLGVNRYKDVLWFNKEAFDEFSWWMSVISLIARSGEKDVSSTELLELIFRLSDLNVKFKKALRKSKFQVAGLLDAL
jgi:hypothetical protein